MDAVHNPQKEAPEVPSSRSQVVVVGAGLAGTAMAAFLARHQVDVLVMDKRAEPSTRPRARMVSARSLELFRELGLAEQILAAGHAGRYEIHVVETLADAPIGEPELDPTAGLSPTGAALCDQDLLEEILRDYAQAHGACFAWGRTVVGIDSGNDDVVVRATGGGSDWTVVGNYAALAEGGRAELTTALGVTALHTEEDDVFHECLFRSDALDRMMEGRPGAGFVCAETPDGGVLRRDAHRWTITRFAQPIDDPPMAVRAAAGREVDVEVISEGTWRPSARLATTFRCGRVFLLGDAAHAMPPSVGMAGNLAVADAHNLAWKLAFVLAGKAGPKLLDSYSPERRSAAAVVLDEALCSMRTELDNPLPDSILQLGVGYAPATSSALHGNSFEQPITDPGVLRPRVGSRLPHHWLPDGRSTLDLVDPDTFIAVRADQRGITVAGTDLLKDLAGLVPPAHADECIWIVRPDGHVAAEVVVDQIGDVLDAITGLADRATAQ